MTDLLKMKQEANSPWPSIEEKAKEARKNGHFSIKLSDEEISKLRNNPQDALRGLPQQGRVLDVPEPPAGWGVGVNHPEYYNRGKIEVIDFINDQKLNFNLGNVIKYICRADYKEGRKQDLEKALWYLQKELGSA